MQRQEEKPLRERARQEPLEERARSLFTPPTEITLAAFNARPPADQPFLLALYTLTGGKYVLNKAVHQLTAAERYGILKSLSAANGISMALVAAVDAVNNRAVLEIHFFNTNYLAEIRSTYTANHTKARLVFPITGGHRLLAGPATGQVQVDSRPAPAPDSVVWPDSNKPVLQLTVAPIGDYSTYTLGVNAGEIAGTPAVMDPLFAEIRFKFRPGCFSTNCASEWEPGTKREPAPVIDYLAKDYDSFRHTMIAAMMQRVPNWQPSSEADLDQVLLELFSAAADELSDYQDRVMNEAYLASSRKRVSLARHARLMDYHIHQGNQASTWLALELDIGGALPEFDLQRGLEVWAGIDKKDDAQSVVFITRNDQPQRVNQLLNSMGLYTWNNAIPALAAGSTSADLKVYLRLYLDVDPAQITAATDQASAVAVQDLIRSGKVKHLLIQERLNPATGSGAGRDRSKRQLLRLLPGNDGAEAMRDPITGEWFVRVRWEEADALRRDYCFTVDCTDVGKIENVSLFHGNLIGVHHGRPKQVVFKDPSVPLNAVVDEFHYERTERWGTLCTLPDRDLAYLNTPPGGDEPPFSTLRIKVATPGSSDKDPWDEVPSLIHSDDSSEGGDHFVVETDEESPGGGRCSRIRFGNGINGRELPKEAEVHCEYQVGQGLAGNIGADRLIHFDQKTPLAAPVLARVRRCWNPFDVTNGRAPEPAAEIIRRAPEAYRARQLRAVTLQDYVDRAQKVPGVSRAAASYAWTGSWRTVRITIDPAGMTELPDPLRGDVARYLDAVRLIGEDLEIRPPRFVPLDIHAALCAGADYWPEDLRFILEQEFSAGYTPDGRMGFFHPDLWTFGQPLRASQIIGHIQRIQGVEHVISVTLKRWNEATPAAQEITSLRPNEIIRVTNDPDHLELGFIFFDVQGGRR